MDNIKQAVKVIKASLELMTDDMKEDFKTRQGGLLIDEAINNACGAINGSEEKEALLSAYAIQEANRAATLLWRERLITDNLESEYRKLPSMKEAADAYNVFTSARKERMDKVMADNQVLADEEKEMDIFKGIINGISAEDAEKQYNAYQAERAKALSAAQR